MLYASSLKTFTDKSKGARHTPNKLTNYNYSTAATMSGLVNKIDEEPTITIQAIEELLLVECGGVIEGTDSNDELYSTISELWAVELKDSSNKKQKSKKGKETQGNRWYRKAYDFWEG